MIVLKVLYEDDEVFLENMRKKNVPTEELKKYQFWEWTQGVGLYGFRSVCHFFGAVGVHSIFGDLGFCILCQFWVVSFWAGASYEDDGCEQYSFHFCCY